MKRSLLVVCLVCAMLASVGVGPARAQSQTGTIYGRVTDQSGAAVPGVSVTLSGPVLLQPLTATTSDTGSYQFPSLDIGTYSVKFELSGFRTLVQNDIKVTVGFNAQVNGQMLVSTVEETVQVSSEAPIVDTRMTGTKTTFSNEALQSIPSARDPWVILQQTAGIAMDRENIGGNMSGQQSNYISRGANPTNNKWSLDGVDITDMAATGGSPSYYDFDAFEEMSIKTGGVGINLVTKSGTDKLRGSARFYRTNDKFESTNITDAMRLKGASAGNPIQDIKDYGFEVGGPLKRGRAWIWGSYGKQNVDVGVVNFYKPSANCQQIKADLAATGGSLSHSLSDVQGCLNADETLLTTTNLKAEVQLFKGNKLSLFNNFAKKERNARNASDTTPIESTVRQTDVTGGGFGAWGWITGPNPTYKFGDQWVVNDRWLVDVQYAHVGNNFILDYHDASLVNVQPYLIVAGTINGRSTPDNNQSVNVRPVNELLFNSTYFLPGKLGGDHSLRVGGYWRDANSYNSTHTPGNAVDRFPDFTEYGKANDCLTLDSKGVPVCQVVLTRDGQSTYDLTNIAVYGQDTYTAGRFTLQLGLRYDRNHDQGLAASVTANPLQPTWLPAVAFGGIDPKIVYNNLSPRLGLTYDVKGDGKTLLKANYAMYWGQVGTGTVASQLNPVSRVAARYGWFDYNNDKFAQANEIVGGCTTTNGVVSCRPALVTETLAAVTGNWDPKNPTSATTANTVDPNLKNDKTTELIVGFDRQIGSHFAVSVNYIFRRYNNLLWPNPPGNPVVGVATNGSDYTATTFTEDPSKCPASQAASCPTVTYFNPNFTIPSVTVLNNRPFHRSFNGVEISGVKRMSSHWLMNASYTWNSTIQHFEPGSYQDPTNVVNQDGYQYDYQTSGSGLANVFVNAKWLAKIGGVYQAPFDFNVSGFYNARQGYIFEPYVTTPSRTFNGGTVNVLLDPVGNNRLPNFQNLDFRVDRPFKFGNSRWIPSMDIFNLFNSNTILALQRQQNATTANNISQVVAPRVVRFGLRVTF
jgi:hypothetical protein